MIRVGRLCEPPGGPEDRDLDGSRSVRVEAFEERFIGGWGHGWYGGAGRSNGTSRSGRTSRARGGEGVVEVERDEEENTRRLVLMAIGLRAKAYFSRPSFLLARFPSRSQKQRSIGYAQTAVHELGKRNESAELASLFLFVFFFFFSPSFFPSKLCEIKKTIQNNAPKLFPSFLSRIFSHAPKPPRRCGTASPCCFCVRESRAPSRRGARRRR